jgi:rubrerythrin
MAYTEFEINNKTGDKENDKFYIAALVQANIEDEASAARKYLQLMPFLCPADQHIIKEIISDEFNHAMKLKAMVYRMVEIKTAKD